MAKQTVEVLVQGGKATPGPPLGPALGPLGLNLMEVVGEINRRTADYSGMDVPVKVIADSETKEFDIEVGSPPVSALIKKSVSIKKGAGNPGTDVVGDISLSEIVKIVDTKGEHMLSYNKANKVKEVIGTCVSMGVTVEGKHPTEIQRAIDEGEYSDVISQE